MHSPAHYVATNTLLVRSARERAHQHSFTLAARIKGVVQVHLETRLWHELEIEYEDGEDHGSIQYHSQMSQLVLLPKHVNG